ncbi:ferredoxin--NADP reductase [Poriferisphaera sp. WC338]|uniref:ferredoxin--NADP reductase n=1 Tax=Poriferisphaera sp. WC338 TaxID=3425129 RepID=UPI003D81BD30
MPEQTSASSSHSSNAQSSPYNATLIERIDLNPMLALFRVRFNDGSVPEFTPGQFATLGLIDPVQPPPSDNPRRKNRGPKLIRRAYSIASPSTQRDYLEFYIVLVEEGKLTPLLWKLQAGDQIFMGEKIAGHFTLDNIPHDKNLVMIATGTGLAPFYSMYETYKNDNRWNRFILIECTRYSEDLGYLQTIRDLDDKDPKLTYFPCVTRDPEDSPFTGHRGRVQTIMPADIFKQTFGFDLTAETSQVFICGNPQMIDQIEEDLTTRGFVTKNRENPDGNIHFERYW